MLAGFKGREKPTETRPRGSMATGCRIVPGSVDGHPWVGGSWYNELAVREAACLSVCATPTLLVGGTTVTAVTSRR